MQSRTAADAESRLFARLSLAGLPRGGGDGDAIRMGILNIMRENGIREGHRPVRFPAVQLPALLLCHAAWVLPCIEDEQQTLAAVGASQLQSLIDQGCAGAWAAAMLCAACHTLLWLQGIECHFLEQWHQKLHTNTTPEDITICEAYLVSAQSQRKPWAHSAQCCRAASPSMAQLGTDGCLCRACLAWLSAEACTGCASQVPACNERASGAPVWQ